MLHVKKNLLGVQSLIPCLIDFLGSSLGISWDFVNKIEEREVSSWFRCLPRVELNMNSFMFGKIPL